MVQSMFKPGIFKRRQVFNSLPYLDPDQGAYGPGGEFSKGFDAGWEACKETAFISLIVVGLIGFVCGMLFVGWLGLLLPSGVGL